MLTLTPGHILILIVSFVAAFIFGYFYRLVLKKFKAKNIQKRAANNIGKTDRIIRISLGIFLLISGLQSWNPIALFFSGFLFYEALFTWCGFYAILGKNTCPID